MIIGPPPNVAVAKAAKTCGRTQRIAVIQRTTLEARARIRLATLRLQRLFLHLLCPPTPAERTYGGSHARALSEACLLLRMRFCRVRLVRGEPRARNALGAWRPYPALAIAVAHLFGSVLDCLSQVNGPRDLLAFGIIVAWWRHAAELVRLLSLFDVCLQPAILVFLHRTHPIIVLHKNQLTPRQCANHARQRCRRLCATHRRGKKKK